MSQYPTDILYAYARLGLDPGEPLERIQQALSDAITYKYATRARTEEVEKLVHYFMARGMLGEIRDSFEKLRKAYHRQAMALHPDRTQGDTKAEENLKAVISAYEIVEAIHSQAREYFRHSEEWRLA
ncbi:MAG: DnaJ domain-containing protein, partial [Pseudomonadota bacterium]|nr:DnaJ domain-containing protein [Pseudomonadota bacterium]